MLAIAELTGTAPMQLAAMTLSSLAEHDGWQLEPFDPAERGAFATITNRGWLRSRGSQLCPRCLADDGVWKLLWRLHTATCCTEHGSYLIGRCPTCQRPFRDHHTTALRVAGTPTVCGNPTGTGRAARCPHDLSHIPTRPAPTGDIARQQAHDQAFRGLPTPVFGQAVTAGEYLASTRSLTVLLLHLAQQTDVGDPSVLPAWAADVASMPRQVWGKRPPEDVELRSAVLSEAHSVVTATDRHQAAERFAPWLELVPRTGESAIAWCTDRTRLTPSLLALLNAAQNPRRRLSHRLQHDKPLVVEARHIPQQIPEPIYQHHLGDILQLRIDTGRTFTSLCLARSLPGTTSWMQAATLIGLPTEVGDRIPALASAALLSSIDELLQRLHATAEDLPLIDYRHREAQVRQLATTTGWFTTWRQGRAGTRPQSVRYAISWLWEHHARGHPATNPADLVGPRQHATYRAFANSLTVTQQHALRGAVR